MHHEVSERCEHVLVVHGDGSGSLEFRFHNEFQRFFSEKCEGIFTLLYMHVHVHFQRSVKMHVHVHMLEFTSKSKPGGADLYKPELPANSQSGFGGYDVGTKATVSRLLIGQSLQERM